MLPFTCRLSDRHTMSIMFDSINGDCVHADLNMLFDSNRSLCVPGCVSFRLMYNLVGAMNVLDHKRLF
jgi:serine/threonine-protein kinase ATR